MLFSNQESAHILARVLNITTNAKRKWFLSKSATGYRCLDAFLFFNEASIDQLLLNRKFKKNKVCSRTVCYDMRNSKDVWAWKGLLNWKTQKTRQSQRKFRQSGEDAAVEAKRTDTKRQTEAQKQSRESKRERQLKCGVLRRCSLTMTQHYLSLSHALRWQGKSPLLTSDEPRVCRSVCECVCLCVCRGVLVVSWTAITPVWLWCASLPVSDVVTVLGAVSVVAMRAFQ